MADQELLKAGQDMVRNKLPEPDSMPESSVRAIAKTMIRDKKLGNADWLRSEIKSEIIRIKAMRSLAKSQGFAPFINMGAKAYRLISNQYAPWVLPVMAKRLRNPEEIKGSKAVQLADAMDILGQSECENAANLLSFVTGSEAWQEAATARDAYLKTVKPSKSKKKKARPGAPPPPPPKTATKEGDPITGRSEVSLKISELPNAGVKSNQHRFFTITSGDKEFKITVKPRMFKKLEAAAEKDCEWVGIITGHIGHISANKTIVLDRAAIQVYEKQPKPGDTIH